MGQVWVSYDVDNGTPRYNSHVNKVLFVTPFKLQMTLFGAQSPSSDTLV